MTQDEAARLLALAEQIRAEVINTPETADFMAGVPLEAAHQRERWGSAHDAGKTPFDWFWLIGYLAQKAASSQVGGDLEKAKHHTISTAAALANWHAQLSGRTDMRPGIGPGNGGDKPGSAHDMAARLASNPGLVSDETATYREALTVIAAGKPDAIGHARAALRARAAQLNLNDGEG